MYLSHPLLLSKCPVMSPFALRSRAQFLLSKYIEVIIGLLLKYKVIGTVTEESQC